MIIAIAVALGLIGIFVFAYQANMHTPVPAGCENLAATCEGCSMTHCTRHPHQPKEGE